jgi:hypothetical protein
VPIGADWCHRLQGPRHRPAAGGHRPPDRVHLPRIVGFIDSLDSSPVRSRTIEEDSQAIEPSGSNGKDRRAGDAVKEVRAGVRKAARPGWSRPAPFRVTCDSLPAIWKSRSAWLRGRVREQRNIMSDGSRPSRAQDALRT